MNRFLFSRFYFPTLALILSLALWCLWIVAH